MLPLDEQKNPENNLNNPEEMDKSLGNPEELQQEGGDSKMKPGEKNDIVPDRPEVPKIKPEKEPTKKRASIGKGSILVEPIKRRSFFSWLTLAWLAFTAATGTFFGIKLRFMFPNVLFEPKQTSKAGYPDDYNIGEVSVNLKEKYGVWIVRSTEEIYALSTVCTHLGCTPNWLKNENKFKCPCHGSGFRKTGINFEGPAPRPLERFKISLANDGQILIDKTKKFAYEKGQWSDPESYLMV